jgi:hypothetical protein
MHWKCLQRWLSFTLSPAISYHSDILIWLSVCNAMPQTAAKEDVKAWGSCFKGTCFLWVSMANQSSTFSDKEDKQEEMPMVSFP